MGTKSTLRCITVPGISHAILGGPLIYEQGGPHPTWHGENHVLLDKDAQVYKSVLIQAPCFLIPLPSILRGLQKPEIMQCTEIKDQNKHVPVLATLSHITSS